MMPFAEENLISDLENRLKDFSSITSLMEQGMGPADMMNRLFEGYDVNINTSIAPSYHCDCSKERVQKAIISIGKKEIEEMIAEQKPIEVNCQFCNKHYIFETADLENMISR